MFLFIILGAVVLVSIGLVGVLFFMLDKEGQKQDSKAVPLTDLDQLRKELSGGTKSGLLEPQKPVLSIDESEVIPPYQPPKISMPVQQAVSPLDDDTYKKRAQELEEELQTISQKAQSQSDEAKQMIENLTQENESLKAQKAQLDAAQQKLAELQAEADGLKTENTGLQSRLEATNAQVKQLEEEMAAFKIQMGTEIANANATVTELTREKETLAAAPQPVPDEPLRQEIESLKAEQVQLKQKCAELEEANQKLRELNTHLMEKTDSLQYEMIKSRAQSSGLERVNFNYKNQVEDFIQKFKAIETNNANLSQAKNRLLGLVEEVKRENAELKAQIDQHKQT